MTFAQLAPILPQESGVDAQGHLTVEGVDIAAAAAAHGTPLIVYSVPEIRSRARAYLDGVADYAGDSHVVYASKAWCSLAVLMELVALGLGTDCASLGELQTSLAAGMPADRIVIHGNNKSDAEIAAAVRAGAGWLVLDDPEEWRRVEAAARNAGRVQRILVRVNPSVDVDTHAHIMTGHEESKFGMDPDAARETLACAAASPHLEADGVHIHLGSQLMRASEWEPAINWLTEWIAEFGLTVHTLDLGGGLGIGYTEDADPPSIRDLVATLAGLVQDRFTTAQLALPRIIVEPGRSIVGPAGLTVYRVGSIKHAGDVHWAAVDGGMSDNIRPALYGATYRAIHVTQADAPAAETYRIAGKHCESGDVLVQEAPLPQLGAGDLIATPATGAYGMSMASNYNSLPRPAVVFVERGTTRLVVRRENLDDLLGRELTPRAGAPA